MDPATSTPSLSSRRLLAAQGWCPPEVVEVLPEQALARPQLIGVLRRHGLPEERLAELETLLRMQERLPSVELLKALATPTAPAPQQFLGRFQGADVLVLTAPWSDPAQLRRFQREMKAVSGVRHPGLLPHLDGGEQKGWCWVALGRPQGESLSSLMGSSGGLDETRALRALRGLAAGLSALASAGLMHRHVTPDIVRVGDDGAGRVWDAGLLRALTGLRRQAELDTPDYLAPEQVRGHGLDERTLVYNCGAVLFHALAATPPFSGSAPELVRKAHLFEQAPDLACLLPDLREDTRRIVATAMRKPPTERYGSLDELVRACERALVALGALEDGPAAIAEAAEPTPPTGAMLTVSDPFAAADAAAEAAGESEPDDISSRILAKHAQMKAEKGGSLPATRPRSTVITQSFLAQSTAPARLDVVLGLVLANGWVDAEAQRKLREFLRMHASTLALRMRGGVSALLEKRGIIDAPQAAALERALADQAPFPHYRLGRILRDDRFGRTYEALEIASGTKVAFKSVRVEDEERRRRFLDERASLARVEHPRLVQALACGADGPLCFATSRLVDGVPLAAQLVDDRIAPEAWALRLAQQAAEALAYVHARTGLSHLALSPDAVLLLRAADETRMYPPGERLMVADSGFAAIAPARRDPAWTPPELLRGEVGDARSDAWSIAALLFRLLTGRSPSTGLASGSADPGVTVPGLHPLTREVVSTALRSDPSARPADLDVLQATLAQAAREVAQESAQEPQIVQPATTVVSTRVLRRNGAAGPLGAKDMRPADGGHPLARREARDADDPWA